MESIGFIGLGTMGGPMAWNLAEAGYDLVVYNRTPERTEPFAEAGEYVAESPFEVAEIADTVVTMVSDDEALLAVLDDWDGNEAVRGLDRGTVLVNASTVSPEATAEAADLTHDTGAEYVDAPVAGTTPAAESGKLTMIVGADTAVLDEVRPVLTAMGEPVLHVGDVGAGTDAKLATNLLLGNMMQGLAEGLVFAKARGIEPGIYLDIVAAGGLDAPFLQAKGDKIRARDFTPQFTVDLLAKDLSLALDAGGDSELTLPATAAVREAIDGARGLGYSDLDMSAVVRFLEDTSGITVTNR